MNIRYYRSNCSLQGSWQSLHRAKRANKPFINNISLSKYLISVVVSVVFVKNDTVGYLILQYIHYSVAKLMIFKN